MAPAHKGYPCSANPFKVIWRASHLGKEMKRFKSFFFNVAVTLWTSVQTVDSPTPKRQLIVRYSPGVAYHHRTIANLRRGSRGFLQLVGLHLRLSSTSCRTNSNVFRDILKCCHHWSSLKFSRTFDQNTAPWGLWYHPQSSLRNTQLHEPCTKNCSF